HRGKLASALQHRASAWIARLQAAGAGGLHPGIRAGGPATPTSDAARAGATTIIALTIKLDPSVGADQSPSCCCCHCDGLPADYGLRALYQPAPHQDGRPVPCSARVPPELSSARTGYRP